MSEASDADVLDRFLDRAARVEARRAAAPGGLDASISFSADIYSAEPTVTQTSPDEEDLRSLVAEIRPLVADSSPIRLGAVWDSLTVGGDDVVRDRVKEIRAEYKRRAKSGALILESGDGTRVRPDKVMDLVLNGEVMHDDPDKKALLERHRDDFPGFVDQVFYNMVRDTVAATRATARLIEEARRAGRLAGPSRGGYGQRQHDGG